MSGVFVNMGCFCLFVLIPYLHFFLIKSLGSMAIVLVNLPFCKAPQVMFIFNVQFFILPKPT